MLGHHGRVVFTAIRECDIVSISAGTVSYKPDARDMLICLCLTGRNPGRSMSPLTTEEGLNANDDSQGRKLAAYL
jgi:hypothetical protein